MLLETAGARELAPSLERRLQRCADGAAWGAPIADVEVQMQKAEWAPALGGMGAKWTPDDDTPVEVAAAWARDQPVIVDFMPHKKINAIKECRALSGMGLKAAKDAVEYMAAHLLP